MDRQLRGIILKLQDRLSEDDRIRFHFYIGNDVPRSYRDDHTLRGTLKLMESLIDQDIINEQDFTFLIDAFDEIQCIDAAKLLREHLRQNRSYELNQSVQSLSSIMPPLFNDFCQDEDNDDEDSHDMVSLFSNQQNMSNINNTMNSDEIISQTSIIDIHKEKLKKTQLLIIFLFSIFWKIIIFIFLISFITCVILFVLFILMKKNNIDQIICETYQFQEKSETNIRNGNISIVTKIIKQKKYFNVSCENVSTTSRLVIFSAIYNIYKKNSDSHHCWSDVTNIVRQKCSLMNCLLYVNDDTFSKDPCHTILKQLIVTYTCTTDQYIFGPVLKDTDLDGEDIKQGDFFVTENVTSIEECGNRCLKVHECVGVVYEISSRFCWFKRSNMGYHCQADRNSMIIFNFQQ